MAILEIVTYGHPALRQKAGKVEVIDDEIEQIVEDLEDTLNLDKGIGLAAPQVGISKQIFLVDLSHTKEKRRVALINPVIVDKSNDTGIYEEGCLSLPEIWGDVVRPKKITIKGQLLTGQSIIIRAKGLFARALQHELDHLYGKLFIDYFNLEDYKKNKTKINGLLVKAEKQFGEAAR